jgi:chemotaxis protein methyltransferase CheR
MTQISEIPMELKQRYFLKSKSMKEPKVRVIKEIRNNVKLAYLNLMDNSYLFNTRFDVVFIRNTLIYFSSEVQRKVLTKVLENLNEGGYLFIGHSESLINMDLPILSIAPSVYIKTKNNR